MSKMRWSYPNYPSQGFCKPGGGYGCEVPQAGFCAPPCAPPCAPLCPPCPPPISAPCGPCVPCGPVGLCDRTVFLTAHLLPFVLPSSCDDSFEGSSSSVSSFSSSTSVCPRPIPQGKGFALFKVKIDHKLKVGTFTWNIHTEKLSSNVCRITVYKANKCGLFEGTPEIYATRIYRQNNPRPNYNGSVEGWTVKSFEKTEDAIHGNWYIRVDTEQFPQGELAGFIRVSKECF